EEFGLTPGAESVIGIAGPVGFTALDENFTLRVRQSGFVLDVPAERLEERRDQVHARLSFQVLREVVIPVGVELSDEPLEALCEDFGRRRHHQAPNVLRGLSLTPSGSVIQPRGSTSCGGDRGEGFKWIFRRELNGSTGQTGLL